MVLAPTLAHTPQNGDGAEILNTALRGGVMHPPGFPLQAWLDRVVVRIPHADPCRAIAFLQLLLHAAAAALIAETLRALGARAIARVLGAAAFALYPPVWSLAVQPEVFALAHLAVAATIWIAVKVALQPVQSRGWGAAIAIGLMGSLGAASHPEALAGLPALIAGALACGRHGDRRVARQVAFAGALVLPAAALYLSLPMLRTGSVWPDWGALRTPADVLRHALRLEYGTFSLSASGGADVSALAVLLGHAPGWWHVGLAALLAGAIVLVRQPRLRVARLPILGTLAAGILLLALARLPEQTYTAEVLARLEGPVVIAGALLIGLGGETMASALGARGGKVVTGLGSLVIAAWLVLGWPEADVSRDSTLELHAQGIAVELPDSAVYASEGDVEVFMGVPTASGPRFPISGPEISPDWYWRDVAPRLEPRALRPGVVVNQWSDFMSACFARRLAVASSSPALIATPLATPELRGLIFVARAGADSELTRASIDAAARLAPLAERLPSLPARGHAFSHFYMRRFARAYAGAAEALRREGDPGLAASADSIADSINRNERADARNRRLRWFAERCTRR